MIMYRIERTLCSVDFTHTAHTAYTTYIAYATYTTCQPCLSLMPAESALLDWCRICGPPYSTQQVPVLPLRLG